MIASWLRGEDHRAEVVGGPGGGLIAEEGRSKDGQQQVLDDQAHRDGDDDHPEELGASTNETKVNVAVQEH